jgi:hypothetical protein
VIRLSRQRPLAAGNGLGHVVETDGEVSQLIRPAQLDAMIQLTRGQLVGGISQQPHGAQHLD